ncbi:hypothetical protein K456DRAFT_40500 [Colletotrichum gloeosporioides 23]|nr:hypothetical protein K456DRAFT_40500 [Colletotrichum gloeosporioides 23]
MIAYAAANCRTTPHANAAETRISPGQGKDVVSLWRDVRFPPEPYLPNTPTEEKATWVPVVVHRIASDAPGVQLRPGAPPALPAIQGNRTPGRTSCLPSTRVFPRQSVLMSAGRSHRRNPWVPAPASLPNTQVLNISMIPIGLFPRTLEYFGQSDRPSRRRRQSGTALRAPPSLTVTVAPRRLLPVVDGRRRWAGCAADSGASRRKNGWETASLCRGAPPSSLCIVKFLIAPLGAPPASVVGTREPGVVGFGPFLGTARPMSVPAAAFPTRAAGRDRRSRGFGFD